MTKDLTVPLPDEQPDRMPTLGSSSLAAECLVAITGIFPSRGPNELESRAAEPRNYANRIRRRLASFLDAKEAAPMKWQRPPSQQSLWKELHAQTTHDELAKWFRNWDGDQAVSVEYMAVISAARDKIKAAWPAFPDPSLGAHHFELAEDEYGDVWHLTRTLTDPETLFDDLDALVLLPVQVEAVAAVYPELYRQIRGLAMLLIQPFVQLGDQPAEKKLLAEREEQLRTLLQVPYDAPFEAKEEPQAQQQQPKQSAPSSAANDSGEDQTPSEHVAQRRLATR